MDVIGGRGLSLRKKQSVKPKISAPRQISNPIQSGTSTPVSLKERPRLVSTNTSSSSLANPVQRSVSRENTADYVKRRYSTRINQLPQDFADAPAVPSLPSNLSVNSHPTDQRRASPVRGEKIPIELKALEDPRLPHEQYVSRLLADASEADIQDYQNELAKLKNRTSSDIQHNVYKNRDQFIKISKEAEKLKTEMRGLKNLMSELTNTLGQTNAALGINTENTSSSRKYANRSSVANLEAMWSSHLQELWRRVEGSQKYLPAIPGRHVIHESGRWVELNTATWKPRRRVHLILLNDHLLIACERKRADQAVSPLPNGHGGKQQKPPPVQVQMYAERCFPLQDIEFSDLNMKTPGSANALSKTSRPQTSNAINVRAGPDSFTFAAMDLDSGEKVTLMAKFRKAAADLRKAMQIDVEDNAPKKSPQRPMSSSGADKIPVNEHLINKSNVLVEVDGKQQTFRMVEAIVDELDINIALQKFPESVEGVELLRRVGTTNKNNLLVQDLVEGKVQESAARLGKSILRQLADTSSFLESSKERASWLSRLGYEGRASEAYLKARSGIINSRSSQCIDQGDLHQYLFQLSFIYFTLIRNTVSIHNVCFSQNLSSACIKWAKEHVDEFNLILSQQLQKLEPGNEMRRSCLETAREHAALLAEVGIDFRNLVGKGIEDFPR